MRKNLLLVCILSILPFVFTFSTDLFFYTQDGWTHLARGAAFYKALMDGQIPVRWAGDLNYSYGMPLFNFVFHMPYIIMSMLIHVGFGLVWSLKILNLVSFLISGIFMYLFANSFFKDQNKALLVTVFYQFFPYRLVDTFVRGSIGEMYAFAFLPVVLYGVATSFRRISLGSSLVISIGTAGLILSHLATGFVFLAISCIFTLVFSRNAKTSFAIFASMLLGLGLSSYYWLAALIDHKYTYGSFFAKDLYQDNFPEFKKLFIPNLLNNPGLRTGDVSTDIGFFHLIAVSLAIVMGVFKKIKKNDLMLIILCFSAFALSIFVMIPASSFVWQKFPLFEQFQFPWRFLGVVGIATSLLSVFLLNLSFFKNKIVFYILIFFVVMTTVVYWYPQLGFRKVDENDYWNYPLDTTYFGETNVIWSAGPASAFPQKPVNIISGTANISNIYKKSNLHTYNIDAKSNSVVVDHTQFFPGWKVEVDGQYAPIQFQDPNNRGEITFPVSTGAHRVKVWFTETKTRLAADLLSALSLLIVLSMIGYVKLYSLTKPHKK